VRKVTKFGLIGAGAMALLLAIGLHVRHGMAAGKSTFDTWRAQSGEAHGGTMIAVNDVRIYYETFGNGRPVLVLHGGLGKLEDMGNQIQALAATRFVIAPDSRGHGRSSDSDAPLSYALMADDMVKVLDALGIGRVDLVGWSDGGIIGLEIAMRHPERIGRMVVISANYDVDGLAHKPATVTDIPPVPDFYKRIAADPAHWPVFYRKVATMWGSQPKFTFAELAIIQAPTLVMAGDHDLIKRDHTDRLAKAIPRAEEVIIPGGTHFAVLEKPNVVDPYILRFLDAAPQ
jgi:pimeloyl-ACP methyl ester carboxylesterase